MNKDQDNLKAELEGDLGLVEHKPPSKADVVKLTPREKEREEAEPFETWSLADAEFKPNTNYLVKGLINPAGTSAIFGQWGTGKSFITLDLCFHISQGLNWLGRKTKKAKTLYVALEGKGGIPNRGMAIKQYYKKEGIIDEETDLTGFRILTPSTFYLANSNSIHKPTLDKLIATVKTENIKYVVIDTLAQALGGSDENNQGMLCILNACRELAFETNAHVSVVHHPPKGNADDLRGHSSLAGSLDLILKLKKDKDAEVISLETLKVKDDTDDNQMVAKLKPVKLGTDEDGDDVFSLVATHFEGEYIGRQKDKTLSKGEKLLWDALLKVGHKLKPERRKLGEPPHHHYIQAYDRKETTIELVKDGFYEGLATGNTDENATDRSKTATGKSKQVLGTTERSSWNRTLKGLESAGKIVCNKYDWWLVDDILNGEEEDNQPF